MFSSTFALQKRASGEVWTLAHWMRHFVQTHPEYKRDSVVSECINYDMLKLVVQLQRELPSIERCR